MPGLDLYNNERNQLGIKKGTVMAATTNDFFLIEILKFWSFRVLNQAIQDTV